MGILSRLRICVSVSQQSVFVVSVDEAFQWNGSGRRISSICTGTLTGGATIHVQYSLRHYLQVGLSEVRRWHMRHLFLKLTMRKASSRSNSFCIGEGATRKMPRLQSIATARSLWRQSAPSTRIFKRSDHFMLYISKDTSTPDAGVSSPVNEGTKRQHHLVVPISDRIAAVRWM